MAERAALKIWQVGVRNSCTPRGAPYWGPRIGGGLYIGFRRLEYGGNWVARYRVGYGKQKHCALGPVSDALDYERAKAAAIAWAKRIDSGMVEHGIKTVSDACRDYVAALTRDDRTRTARDSELQFARHVYTHRLGALPLEKVATTDIEQWRADVAKARENVGRPLAAPTLNRIVTRLKAALNRAVARRYVSRERALEWELVKPYKASSRRTLFLDRGQRRSLLAAAAPDVRDLMEAVMLTGCRPGDPQVARVADFNPHTATVTFGTKGHPRQVPLSPAAAALFKRCARDKLPHAFLFTRADGLPWSQNIKPDKGVKEAARKAGLPEGTVLYTLRHCFITEAIQSGMSPLEVARLTGTSMKMIDQHYGHEVRGTRERLAAVDMF